MSSIPIVQKVTAFDGGPQNWFGSSLAIHGDLAVIGAPNASVNANASQGAVYVFSRAGGIWTQKQKLVAEDGAPSDSFGASVAMFGGKIIIVTAPFATVNGQFWAGAAYVFQQHGNSWVQTQKLTPNDGQPIGTFGKCVAIDGAYALIGAGGTVTLTSHVIGSVYVFKLVPGHAGSLWTQVQQISAPDPNDSTANFANAVAISGNAAFVGAFASSVANKPGQGIVYAYKLVGGIWTLSDKLAASNGAARDNFGVSITVEGKTAFIGANGATVHGNVGQGSVYRFENNGTHWIQEQQLVVPGVTDANAFGASVSLAGPSVLIGAYATNSYRGAAYIFGRASDLIGSWTLKRELRRGETDPGDVFGYHVALDSDTALISAYGQDVGSNAAQGAAYLYKMSPLES